MTFTHALPTNNYGSAKFIVDASAANGTHTTIASALTSASSGDTIFIRPGTYTENLTLKAGVNLAAYECDGLTPNVTVIGKMTYTTAGTVSISGIRMQTNSDFLLAVTGSAASTVFIRDCYLNCTNNTGISFTSSSSSASISLDDCLGDIGTTGITFFASSSAGALNINSTRLGNSGNSTTASTNSDGSLNIYYSLLPIPLSLSSTGTCNIEYCEIQNSGINATSLTTAGTGVSSALYSYFNSGTASAISVGAGTTLSLRGAVVVSSNTNAITGAGTLNYSGIQFFGTSSTINTTTQTGGIANGGRFQAPSAGFIGEEIRATVASGSAVSLTSNTGANVTSISLTAGIWDVSGMVLFGSTPTGTNFGGSIGTTSATVGTIGDNYIATPTAPTGASNSGVSIPSYRITLSSTTTVYLVALAVFTVGTCNAFGRISATRVG